MIAFWQFSDGDGHRTSCADIDANDAYRLLRGPPGTIVAFRVTTESGEERTVVLKRKLAESVTHSSLTFHGSGLVLTTLRGAHHQTLDGQLIRQFPVASALDVAASSDGQLLALTDWKDLILWNTQKNSLQARLATHAKSFACQRPRSARERLFLS